MSNKDKKDKSAEEIIEETMQEIYENKEKQKKKEKSPASGIRPDQDCIDIDAEFEDVYTDEDDEFDEDDLGEDRPKKKGSGRGKKIAAITCGGILGAAALVYGGFALYFSSHFIFGTTVNGIDVSMKNEKQTEAVMERQVDDYTLVIEGSDGKKEEIEGADIALEYAPQGDIRKILKEQDSLLWVKAFWDKPEIEAPVNVKYDERALEQKIGNLQCLVPENQVASVDAHPEFQNTEFVVVPEVVGTQIDTAKFESAVKTAVSEFRPTLQLKDTDCYLLPRFVSDSPEVIAAKDAMNSYLGASVTYDFNPNTEVVNAPVIAQWITCDANMSVVFNEAAVKQYIATLAGKYNTKGQPRQFTTANGNVVTVEGGKFGWMIDQNAEYNALIANIQNGETVTREPAYSSRGVSHGSIDIGNTYAEVDLTNQHMWFIQNGQVVMDSPIVTGNPNKGNATPQGTYSLTYKTRNATLRGEKRPDGTYSYETPVAYWMPFNGGIGFHDATWQSSFGGSRYKSHGSHGCINMPKEKAKQLYELLPEKCPVVCHY